RLYWREDGGKTGTATLVEEAPQQEPAAPKTVVAETEPVAGPTSPMRPTASQPKKTPEAIPSRQANTLAEFEPLPLPVRAPARASEVRVAVVPPAAGVSDAPETDAPVETATVAVSASDQDDISDIPMMRF